VLARSLWPRSLESLIAAQAVTDADRHAYEAYPQLQRQVHNIDVHAHVTEEPSDPASDQTLPRDPPHTRGSGEVS